MDFRSVFPTYAVKKAVISESAACGTIYPSTETAAFDWTTDTSVTSNGIAINFCTSSTTNGCLLVSEFPSSSPSPSPSLTQTPSPSVSNAPLPAFVSFAVTLFYPSSLDPKSGNVTALAASLLAMRCDYARITGQPLSSVIIASTDPSTDLPNLAAAMNTANGDSPCAIPLRRLQSVAARGGEQALEQKHVAAAAVALPASARSYDSALLRQLAATKKRRLLLGTTSFAAIWIKIASYDRTQASLNSIAAAISNASPAAMAELANAWPAVWSIAPDVYVANYRDPLELTTAPEEFHSEPFIPGRSPALIIGLLVSSAAMVILFAGCVLLAADSVHNKPD